MRKNIKSFFDFTFQPKLDRQKVMSLYNLTFTRDNNDIIFLGPPGVGKTHLAVSLALKACIVSQSQYGDQYPGKQLEASWKNIRQESGFN